VKVLVLGGTGMIGHRMWATLSTLGHDVFAVTRSENLEEYSLIPGIDLEKAIKGVDVLDYAKLEEIVLELRSDYVLNCTGIVKQHKLSSESSIVIEQNALFPHKLADICNKSHSKMIQFSTDCVFDGIKGNYSEVDTPNASDLYGLSKILGEISERENVITFRTSTVGREVRPHGGLVEWFLSNRGAEVSGFKKAMYSGFPAHTLAKVISDYIFPDSTLSGIVHLSTKPINKFDLLKLVNERFELNTQINENNEFEMKRELNSEKFRERASMPNMDWKDIVDDLSVDWDIYEKIRLK
jgi:dTDP-4-dehydrorhamnose reductase